MDHRNNTHTNQNISEAYQLLFFPFLLEYLLKPPMRDVGHQTEKALNLQQSFRVSDTR